MNSPADSYKQWHKPKKLTEIFNPDGSIKKGKTLEGYYRPKYPEKYIGNPNLIIYRSSWEYSFSKWCDYSPSILRWSSEPVSVPYYDKVSKLEECKKLGLNPNNPKNWIRKNYHTDFWIEIKKDSGNIEKWFIEIKPKKKLKRPDPVPADSPLRIQRAYVNRVKEYLINEEKFNAMKKWANEHGAKFFIFTEDHLKKFGIIGGRFDYKINNKRKFD